MSQTVLSRTGPIRHDVRFYTNDHSLVETVITFIGEGLSRGGAGVIIATEAHRRAIEDGLERQGIVVRNAIAEGRLMVLDAGEMLVRFMQSGLPDPDCFAASVARIARYISARFHEVRAYGEMVDLLAAEGNHVGALVLEELWNDLIAELPLHLLCGYRLERFNRQSHQESFRHVCRAHACVLPSESYGRLETADSRARTIAEFEQQAAALATEVDECQRIGSALRRSEDAFGEFFENAAVGFQQVACNGVIRNANRALLHLLGYRRDEYIGRHFSEFHVDGDDTAALRQCLSTGQLQRNHRARLRCRDGAIKQVMIGTDPRWEDGQLLHTHCSISDISEQLRLEEALKLKTAQHARSEAELKRMFHLATHDLQEPLRLITQYMNLIQLLGGDRLDDQVRQYICYAVGGAQRMRELIHALFGFGQVVQEEPRLQDIDLRPLAEDAAAGFAVALHEAGATMTLGPLATVHGDAAKLRQVFQHLIENALKYRASVPLMIAISAVAEDGHATVSISDNGIGIEPAHHQRVFDLLERLHGQRDHPGTGIGLSVCKRIIEQHGGEMWVESTPGAGSTFRFTVPKRQTDRH